MSEDCLFAAVYAPSRATQCKPLPVFVLIQGGGFNKNADGNTNGTGLIQAADLGMVVVTFNYRVGVYGFMTDGDANSPLVDTNIGLHDQRKLLQWVQKYISRFGGDPRHVVLGGDSAGAASVTYHLTAYDGKDEGLFVASTAESQSFGPVRTAEESRYQYTDLAKRLGCWRDADAATVACMRAAPVSALQNTSKSITYPEISTLPRTAPPKFMWNPFIDGKLIKDLTYRRFSEGKYIRVPTIFGDVTNEGTMYAPTNATSLADSHTFLRNNFPAVTDAQLAGMDKLWPNRNQSACPSTGCFYGHASDLYGEIRYVCPGLFLARTLTTTPALRRPAVAPPLWLYHYNALDPAQNESGLGVPHVVELNAIWGPENLLYPAPVSYFPGGINQGTIPVMQGYWTSFIRFLDPNKARAGGSAEWSAWHGTSTQGRRLLVGTGGTTAMEAVDGQLKAKCAFSDAIALELDQ